MEKHLQHTTTGHSTQSGSNIATGLSEVLAFPYRSYLYSYPHKTAYRELDPPLPLGPLWERENTDTYFLYMHIPFCAARCGFCNLFTLPDRRDDTHERYVDALERQAKQWAPITSRRPYSRFAIGGGTPTLLNEVQLNRLFDIAEHVMGLDPAKASISVETSPDTVTEAKLAIMKERSVDRISMGIQSFIEAEASAIYRPQKPQEVERALEKLTRYDFPLLNLDLIYGLPGQTVESWIYSLERVLAYEPGEIFIYPLYTRENTIVKPDDIRRQGPDIRMELYKAARETLKSKGYVQYSMRRFAKEQSSSKVLLPYSCQEEGMVGLGCGARSYTSEVHYASKYGVSYKATQSIIADYVATERYDVADYGIVLSREEQRRRFILKALLHREGLTLSDYQQRFGTDVMSDYVWLAELLTEGMAELESDEGKQVLRLTEEGLGYSDAIGDWLISAEIREQMEGFVFS
ncbi:MULTISPECIES: STM4012 family radical SAM protein [Paenibacillus]|uniref:STM4012 family radical SAM protein n=1 Tax=Paenibacillus TaxID=44249 RepID=UPI00201E3E4B|nr:MULTISPECIES: STM4012 family radical SAM protein [Paenibacillus]MCL6662609.1 STM4012 family radical SAM protein [Paenibacillus amylolyticus]WJM07283.1 STM4012 family radical SAM protein [Paenibacillus sp. PK1-4R]